MRKCSTSTHYQLHIHMCMYKDSHPLNHLSVYPSIRHFITSLAHVPLPIYLMRKYNNCIVQQTIFALPTDEQTNATQQENVTITSFSVFCSSSFSCRLHFSGILLYFVTESHYLGDTFPHLHIEHSAETFGNARELPFSQEERKPNSCIALSSNSWRVCCCSLSV